MKNRVSIQTVFGHPIHFLAFGFGSGLAPVAPGTFGTLVGIPFFLLMVSLPLWLYIFFVLVFFLFGVWLCDRSSKLLGVHDHGGIVWDEIVGYLVTMMAAPKGWEWITIGFVLFRVFDIFKPWPIGYLDRHVSGGLGIMIDDILAGIYAMLILQLWVHFFV